MNTLNTNPKRPVGRPQNTEASESVHLYLSSQNLNFFQQLADYQQISLSAHINRTLTSIRTEAEKKAEADATAALLAHKQELVQAYAHTYINRFKFQGERFICNLFGKDYSLSNYNEALMEEFIRISDELGLSRGEPKPRSEWKDKNDAHNAADYDFNNRIKNLKAEASK